MFTFFKENWFWRGTQSAIFYYASCAPWMDYRHKRKRRNEAARDNKQQLELVTTQPGQIRQPGAFQTNEDWVEEILVGPGPPKGWKPDPIIQKLTTHERDLIRKRGGQLDGPVDRKTLDAIDQATTDEHLAVAERAQNSAVPSTGHDNPHDKGKGRADELQRHPTASVTSQRLSIDSTTSSSSEEPVRNRLARPRLSMERRLSSAVDNIKVTLRSTMHSDRWNWKRYEREDEILTGFNERMSKMWDRATNFTILGQADGETTRRDGSRNRKRAPTNESDRFDYAKYSRNPEINELSPPVVSRLPVTSNDAAWMLLPAPSRAVMEGKSRPHEEPALRWPLALIDRNEAEWEVIKEKQRQTESQSQWFPQGIVRQGTGETRSISGSERFPMTESPPDLSDSLSERHTSDEEDNIRDHQREDDYWSMKAKRYSAPVLPGWIDLEPPPPVITTADVVILRNPPVI